MSITADTSDDDLINIINTSGVQGAVTVTSSATVIRVGGSNLSNRQLVTVYNNSSVTLYWGYTNAVTTSTGTPIFKDQFFSWTVGPSVDVYLIAASGSNNVRVTEGA